MGQVTWKYNQCTKLWECTRLLQKHKTNEIHEINQTMKREAISQKNIFAILQT